MECSGEKGLNKGRIHNNDTISLFSFTKDRLDMYGQKKKIQLRLRRQHARHRCENGNVRRCGAENPTTSIQDSQNVKSKK